MAKMVITHKVEDVEKWLKGKVERAEAIAHLGGKRRRPRLDRREQQRGDHGRRERSCGDDHSSCLAVSGAHYGHGESRCHPTAGTPHREVTPHSGKPARLAPDVGWLRVQPLIAVVRAAQGTVPGRSSSVGGWIVRRSTEGVEPRERHRHALDPRLAIRSGLAEFRGCR